MKTFVGVDVGAKSVAVAWRRAGSLVASGEFSQDIKGHATLIEKLTGADVGCVVLEATGIYYLDLAVALRRAGLPVAVINPRSFHHFASLKLSTRKTDAVDAALLAEYGECLKPALWQAPDDRLMGLRDLGRQINRLTATRTQAKNRLHAMKSKSSTLELLIEDELYAIGQLDQRIEKLGKAAAELIGEDKAHQGHLLNLQKAKGVGQASAVALLAELSVLPKEMKSAQVSRYAGLDVRVCQSGSSVNKPGRLSKAGNAYLRAALYMPALTAVRHEVYAKAFYESLLARGKKKMQALCAVMRKMLTGIWACIKSGQAFDASKLFDEKHLKTA